MEHEATGLVREEGRITGVEVKTPGGTMAVHTGLVVACDGRHSLTRRYAGLEVVDSGVPIDVLWFRISRNSTDIEQVLGRVNYGKALILINRGDYFQAGLIIRKGSFGQIQRDGLENFRAEVARIAPFLADRVPELCDWDQVKLLTVQINHLRQWYSSGLLCIGDAAHAMSPAGGVGINLAIQDAVAAARILAGALRDHRSTDHLLPRVQQRRKFPTRVTQFLQKRAHVALAGVFDRPGPLEAPWPFKMAVRVPGVQRLLGHIIGIGIRPEHVRRRTGNRLLTGIACGIGATLALVSWRHPIGSPVPVRRQR
jgi:2-polyprenyl-6-methoxyphenol hydroxylase-like FAD-dependent oxidoreductase